MLLPSILRVLFTRSFKPFIFKSEFQNALTYENLDHLGLYVHIPFCRSLCSFCPYCKEIYSQEKADAYKNALLREIELVCAGKTDKKRVTNLFFGGGTPALMINDLHDIIDKLQDYFLITGGIGVELHPEDITESNLNKLKTAGVTMVSVGIQSFNQSCLKKLGRETDTLLERIQRIRRHSFAVFDVDLIFAIPGQTDKTLAKDIKTAFELGATQVSTYPFIDFTFADNTFKPMSQKRKKEMLKKLATCCSQLQVKRTSVWTFAKQNTARYSSVTRDAFLGFGVSATTLLKDSFKINTFSIEEYVKRVRDAMLPTALTLSFTKRQRALYFLFWSAYSMKIDENKFENLMGIPLKNMFGLELFLAEKFGLLNKKDNTYHLSDRAIQIYHHIEQIYTRAYIDQMWNILRLQAFPKQLVL